MVAVGRGDAIAKGVRQFAVRHGEGAHADQRIGIHRPFGDLMHVGFPSVRRRPSCTAQPLLYIDGVAVEDAVDQSLRARWAIDLQRCLASLDPRGEEHVVQTHRVIRMQMGQEDDAEPRRIQRGDPIALRRHGAADHAGAGIEQVGGAVDYDRDSGAGALGHRNRCAAAEDDHASAECLPSERGCAGERQQESDGGTHLPRYRFPATKSSGCAAAAWLRIAARSRSMRARRAR